MTDHDTIPCLVICQPWPWAIFHAPQPKRVENRSWHSFHRGPLLIMAGKSKSYLGAIGWLWENSQPCPSASKLVYGSIIGIVEQIACVRSHEALERWPDQALYIDGPWCHVYEQARAFRRPVPYRGQQGLFPVPESAVARQLRELVS